MIPRYGRMIVFSKYTTFVIKSLMISLKKRAVYKVGLVSSWSRTDTVEFYIFT